MERRDFTSGIRGRGSSLSPDSTELLALRSHPVAGLLSLGRALGCSSSAGSWGCLAVALPGAALCPGWAGAPLGSPPKPKPCFGTVTGEQKLCRAAPHNHCLSTLLFLFLQYHMEVRKLLCSLKKGKRNKYFYVAKIFVLTCSLKTCPAQSRSALVSQLCCMKQSRGQSYTCIQAAGKSPIINFTFLIFFYVHNSGI